MSSTGNVVLISFSVHNLSVTKNQTFCMNLQRTERLPFVLICNGDMFDDLMILFLFHCFKIMDKKMQLFKGTLKLGGKLKKTAVLLSDNNIHS